MIQLYNTKSKSTTTDDLSECEPKKKTKQNKTKQKKQIESVAIDKNKKYEIFYQTILTSCE